MRYWFHIASQASNAHTKTGPFSQENLLLDSPTSRENGLKMTNKTLWKLI